MTEENRVVVKHVYREEAIRYEPIGTTPQPIREDPEKSKWCWTRIQEAVQRNANFSEVLQILLESCLVLIIFIIENLIGILSLILGIIYLNDCPIQKSLPISMIVYGVFSILRGITIQLVRWKFCDIDNNKDGFGTCAKIIVTMASIVTLVAFIWASFAVFSIYREVKTDKTDQMSDKYCNGVLYWFTYWFFIILFVIICFFLIIFCCLCCCLICCVLPYENSYSTKQVITIHESEAGNQLIASGPPVAPVANVQQQWVDVNVNVQ